MGNKRGNKSPTAEGTLTILLLSLFLAVNLRMKFEGLGCLIPGLDSCVLAGYSPTGNDIGHCLPSSWFLTCVPWLGTLGR